MNFFIGLDQTGAVNPKGHPKPLPLAFLDGRSGLLRTRALNGRPLTLPTFSRDALEAVLVENAVEDAHEIVRSPKTGLFVDAVFGLPMGLKAPSPRELFVSASQHEGYGLKAAAGFFKTLAPQIDYPVRRCESLAKANSVFRTHPYQKNIQCGTYRIWRDLGLHGSDWVHLRYFEKKKPTRPILYEAYPSLMWKQLLQLQTRDRTKLEASLKKFDVEIPKDDLQLMIENADHADAAMLALGGFFLRPEVSRSTDERLSKEGWILGLDETEHS